MKRFFWLAALMALVSAAGMVFAAGGGQQGAGGGAVTAPAATGVIGDNLKYDLATPVNGGRNITIEFWSQNELLRVHEKLAAEYSRIHPNVKINISPMSSTDLFQKLPIALQTGTGPDIFHMHNAQDGLLGPYLAPYPEDILPLAALRADFDQVDAHLQNGKLYYIDMGVMTSGIFYNKKMWRDAGLTDADIPTSWDQLIQAAKKLTVYDQSGNITREGFSINSNEQYIFEALALQSGRFLFDANSKPVVNNDVWKQNLKFVQDFFTVHKTSSIQFPNGHEALVNEQGAMAYIWGWAGSWLINYPNLEWGFFNLPSKDGRPAPAYDRNNGESTFSVGNTARKEAQAVGFDILKYFLCKDDLLVEMDMLLNIVPTKKSLKGNPTILGNVVLGTQSKIIDRTIWPGAVPDPYFSTINTYAVQAVLINGASIDAALAETQAMEERDFVQAFPDFKSAERQYAHANELR
jgi:multiple sugar transport system substrate-binding protein